MEILAIPTKTAHPPYTEDRFHEEVCKKTLTLRRLRFLDKEVAQLWAVQETQTFSEEVSILYQ